MTTCIYCLENKSPSDFDKDHVMPESFGTFKNNFTLVETVCKDCNHHFGNELELFLGRDTFEGMLRYIYKVKSPTDFKFMNNSRIIFRLNEEGPWKNAIMQLKYDEDHNEVVVEPVPQVGFKKKDTGDWIFFEIKDIKLKDDLEKQGIVVKGRRILKILFNSESEKEEIEKQLSEKGFKVTTESNEPLPFEYNGQTVHTAIHVTIDKIIFRGIGKIAFNYLVYIEGRNFGLNENFNNIRMFIRYGKTNNRIHVTAQIRPILEFERRLNIRETQGHLITLGWDTNKATLFSQVSLFNTINYKVILVYKFRGLLRNIECGHHFDIDKREISKLLRFPKKFYLP